ncbi:type II secretion system secretin GspD [Burkholderia guangdongensis]|uniref:type II secretion system secretin GspD n=1 Tax=Burkholderia guangdongensis TaxID=1792500 RepID=UPI0015CC51C5|nr:type II secretion system secretin GspD [Burkholderia guangdongensis]
MTRTRFVIRRVATALAVAGIVVAQAAHAQVTLNFVNADIDQVAKAIGAATGKTIIVDPRVKGQLNLVAERPVPEEQALKTLQSALRMQGFSLVQDHGVLKVVPEADAKLQGVPTYIGNVPQARGDQIITQVFELHNESANNLLPVLRPLISPNNTVTAYPANNTVVVTDYADNVRRIAQIIAGIDNAAGEQVLVVPLKNANALDAASQLSKLLDPGAIGNSDATLKVSVSADPRTNSLLLRASNASRLAAAKRLALQLDAPTGQPGNMHVVRLHNADAVKLAKTLRGMLGKGAGETGASATSNDANSFNQGGASGSGNFSTGTPGTPPLPSSMSGSSSSSYGGTGGGGSNTGLGNSSFLGGDKDKSDDNQPGGMIQADPATNSLIITASDPVYRNLRTVIEQLDARRAQVYLEALIVELSANTDANLGIQWQGALLSGNNAVYGGSNIPALGVGTVGNGNSIVDLTVQGNTINQNAIINGTTTLTGVLQNGLNIGWLHKFGSIWGLGGLLQALSQTSDANILSTPNLITLDNEEAQIVVGQNVPIPTGSYSNLTAGNTSTAFNTYDRRDVGITLHVKPQITDGGILKLQLYTESSSVAAGTLTNATGPTFNKRSIQSTVLADDGQIIVLGGLMQDSYSTGVNKVPLLGDIPWLGQFFRSESKSRQKTNLMVFLRPVIVRDGATSEAITQNRYDYARGQQGAYQSDNRLIRDKDTPMLPPAPLTPSQGGVPALNLFDLDNMRRLPPPAQPSQPAQPTQQQAPVAQPQAVPQQQVPQQAMPAASAAPAVSGAAQ